MKAESIDQKGSDARNLYEVHLGAAVPNLHKARMDVETFF